MLIALASQLTAYLPPFQKQPLKDKGRRAMLADFLELLLIYATTTANLEISTGIALYSWLHVVQHDCLGGDKEQHLSSCYGVIILKVTSA